MQEVDLTRIKGVVYRDMVSYGKGEEIEGRVVDSATVYSFLLGRVMFH